MSDSRVLVTGASGNVGTHVVTALPARGVPGYLRHLRRLGLPVPQRLVQTVLHVGLRRGSGADGTMAVRAEVAGARREPDPRRR